jgi:hypothetical protein
MRGWLAIVGGVVTTLALTLAPTASAVGDAPIGKVGDRLRVDLGDTVADFTLNDVQPTFLQDGMLPSRGIIWRADMTVHVIKAPTPFDMAIAITYSGVTPFADAYLSVHSAAPDGLENVLTNAPAGSTVSGAVFFDVYRDPMSNVIVRSKKSGDHLAQWNL